MITDIFIKVINNKFIFSSISKNIIKIHNDLELDTYRWEQLLSEPHVLLSYQYIDQFKHYCKRYQFNSGMTMKSESKYFCDLLSCAVKYGCGLQALKYFIEDLQFDLNSLNKGAPNQLLLEALQYNRVDVIDYLLIEHSNVEWDYKQCLILVPTSINIDQFKRISNIIGRDTVVDWNKGFFASPFSMAATQIFYEKTPEWFQWLCENRPHEEWSKKNIIQDIYRKAILTGNLELVKNFVEEKELPIEITDLFEWALNCYTLEMLQYLVEKKLVDLECDEPLNVDMITDMARLVWLNSIHPNLKCTTKLMDNAADRGDLEMIKWLHQNRTEGCTTNAMDNASINGRFEIVKWLHENRTEGCTYRAMTFSAVNSHMEIAEWLHLNKSEGYMNPGFAESLLQYGNLSMVKWLVTRYPETILSCNAIDYAADYGHLEIVQWLHENRNTIFKGRELCTTRAMDMAASNSHFEIVKWLHENRTEGCTTEAIDLAKRMDIINFLHSNRSEGCTEKAIYTSISSFNFEKIKWIYEHRPELRYVFDSEPIVTKIIIRNVYQPRHFDTLNFVFSCISETRLLVQIRDNLLKVFSPSNLLIITLNRYIY